MICYILIRQYIYSLTLFLSWHGHSVPTVWPPICSLVISNSLLFQTQNCFPQICLSVIYNSVSYFKLSQSILSSFLFLLRVCNSRIQLYYYQYIFDRCIASEKQPKKQFLNLLIFRGHFQFSFSPENTFMFFLFCLLIHCLFFFFRTSHIQFVSSSVCVLVPPFVSAVLFFSL